MLQVAVMVLSLTKLSNSLFLIHKNKSLKNILKRIGHDIELWDASNKMLRNTLKMLFIQTFCFRSFKYKFRKVIASKLSP